MQQKYSCPWCEYSAGTENSVRSHITRKTSGEHKGVNGYDLEASDLTNGSVDTSADSAGKGDSSPSSDSAGLGIPDTSESSDGGSSSETVQTPCGCETFDASGLDIPESGLILQCDTCGREFEVYP